MLETYERDVIASDGADDCMSGSRSESQEAAIELMRAAGQEVRDAPGEPSAETRLLRAKLTFEEAMETINALGFSIRFEGPVASIPPQIFFVDDRPFSLIEAVDGCCDSNVINAGTLAALGVPDLPFQREVERSNRSKLLNDGTLPPHPTVAGKFGKGPNYTPPDIEGALKRLGVML
jgi:predicted HAD superfamily Cof-like phosphohydrolase